MKKYIDKARLQALKERFLTIEYDEEMEQPAIYASAEGLTELLRFLKEDAAFLFNRLESVTSVDYKTYFEMVYHLFSWSDHNDWLTVKVKLDHDTPSVPSVTGVFPGVEFEEREVYDLMGISFIGHPDLRRILLADDFSGHPLRKDYKAVAPPHVPRIRREGGRNYATY